MTSQRTRTVMPIITVESVDELQDFYVGRLGFTRLTGIMGEDGRLGMISVGLGGAKLMFVRPRARTGEMRFGAGRRPVEIYLEVDDVDAYHAQLSGRDVPISDPLTVQWWGDKTFKVTDPCGYELWFYEKIGEPRPPRGVKIV